MQRETVGAAAEVGSGFISILSLYAEGDFKRIVSEIFDDGISILSLYAEGDYMPLNQVGRYPISILSLYAEGDSDTLIKFNGNFWDFNPLPLCRGRLCRQFVVKRKNKFQSSPSMQRETESGRLGDAINELFQSSPSMQRETVWVNIAL